MTTPSAIRHGANREGVSEAASIKVVWRARLSDTPNERELPQVPLDSTSQRVLRGLSQKACSGMTHSSYGSHGQSHCRYTGRGYLIRVIGTKHGKPDIPPYGRQVVPRGRLKGWRAKERWKKQRPFCNGVDTGVGRTIGFCESRSSSRCRVITVITRAQTLRSGSSCNCHDMIRHFRAQSSAKFSA